MKILAITTLVTLLVFGLASANDPDQAICVQQVKDVIGRLNILYARQHAPLIPFDNAQLSCDRQGSTLWKTPLYRCSFPSGIFIECLPEKGQVVSYIGSNPDIFFDKMPVAQLTLEQAAEAAKPWMKAVLGNLPPYLAPPRGTFTFNERGAHRFYSGEWQIRWPRTDSQGHLFELDNFSASFSEKFGLIGFGNNFHSTFDESTGKLISKEEAQAVARPTAATWLNNQMLASGIPSGWHLGTLHSELWVVNPNNFFQIRKGEQVVNDPHARLAWRFVFPLVSEKPLSEFDRPHTLVVKINAQTTEILGGDFK